MWFLRLASGEDFAEHRERDDLILAKAACFSIARRARYLWSWWPRVYMYSCIGSSCFLFIMPACLSGLYCAGVNARAAPFLKPRSTIHKPILRGRAPSASTPTRKVDRKPRIVWQRIPSYLATCLPIYFAEKCMSFRVDTYMVHRSCECRRNPFIDRRRTLEISM